MSVFYDTRRKKYIARAMINGKRTYLGQFDSRAEAEYVVANSKPSVTENFGKLFDSASVKPGLITRFLDRLTGKKYL